MPFVKFETLRSRGKEMERVVAVLSPIFEPIFKDLRSIADGCEFGINSKPLDGVPSLCVQ